MCVAASPAALVLGRPADSHSAMFVHLNGCPPISDSEAERANERRVRERRPTPLSLSLSLSSHSWQSYFLRYATATARGRGEKQRGKAVARALGPLLFLMDLMMNRAEIVSG